MAEEPQHPIQVKAKGKTLVTKSKRLLDNIPPEFKAEAVTRIEKQAVPTETDIDPTFSSGQMGSSVEMDNTTQSQKINEFLDQDMPVILVDSVVTPEGQLGTRTRTLDEGIQTIILDPKQIEANVDNIGADRSIKSTVVVPEVFPADLLAKERPETIPERFRAAVPLTTTRLDSEGDAAMPTLGTGDVAKSSEQTKEGIIRETTSNRDPTVLPVTLLGSEQTNEGQIAAVTEILDDSVQTITSSPTQVEASVVNLGDGNTLKTTKVVPSVFGNQQFAKERPEVIPEKFRTAVPLVTTRLDAAGTAASPTLGVGEVAKSSEQIREGVKRDSSQTRDLTGLTPVSLSGQEMTAEQQVATVTETLDDGAQTVAPSATVLEDKVVALGDGSTVRSRKTVPSVFPSSVFSKERPEVIPTAFRSAIPSETTRSDSAGTAAMPTLGISDIEKSSQQLTEFIRRETTKTRALPGTFPTISLRSWDNDLQSEIITTLDIVAMGSAYTPPSGVIDYDESELDDQYTLRKVFSLPGGVGTPTLPASYDSTEPGSFYFPGTLTNIVVAVVALATVGDDDDPRNEVNWQPVWRPGFTMDVNFIITTSFHLTAPSPDTQYVIRTNDIVFKGVSFQVSIPRVLNNALTTIGVTFVGDALYGNLSENFSVAASVPTATAYNAAIGTTQVVASKVAPWRRLWVKRTTKVVLL